MNFFFYVCVSITLPSPIFVLLEVEPGQACVIYMVCVCLLCFHIKFAFPSCSQQKHRIHKVNERCLRVPFFFFTHNNVFYVCWPGFVTSVVELCGFTRLIFLWSLVEPSYLFFTLPLPLFVVVVVVTVASPFECGLSCLLLLSWFP